MVWRRRLTSIVVADDSGTPLRRGEFQSICRRGRRADRHTEAEDEPPAEEVGVGLGGGLDGGADHDEDGAGHHAGATTEAIADGAGEEGANHVANGVNHKDAGPVRTRTCKIFSSNLGYLHASGRAELSVVKVFLILRHRVDGAENGL